MRPSALPRIAAALLLAASTFACSDQPLAPADRNARSDRPNFDVIIDNIDELELTTEVDFTVTPTGGWFMAGPHSLFFPNNSICEPSTSSYGPSAWDAPCEPATGNVQIHASMSKGLVDGLPRIHFTPDLRFVPSADSAQWVVLYMYSEEARTQMTEDEIQNKYRILWKPSPDVEAIDESIVDNTLRSRTMPQYGMVYRRVKHFSGYQVGSGLLDLLGETIPSPF